MSNYFLNLEILNRISNGNTMAHMEDERIDLEYEAMKVEEKTNGWLKEGSHGIKSETA